MCAEYGARLVFMSSAAVYGNPSRVPTPTSAPVQPVNVYGVTKARAEGVVREHLPRDAVIFRLFNAYGERCDRSYVIPDVIRKALSRLNPVPMQGFGTESRDFVYIRDVVAAIETAVRGTGWGTFNLGTGRTTSIRSVAELILRSLSLRHYGLDFEGTSRLGDFRISWADLSDGNALAGWRPRWSLEEGVRNTVAHYVPGILAQQETGSLLAAEAAVPVLMAPRTFSALAVARGGGAAVSPPGAKYARVQEGGRTQ